MRARRQFDRKRLPSLIFLAHGGAGQFYAVPLERLIKSIDGIAKAHARDEIPQQMDNAIDTAVPGDSVPIDRKCQFRYYGHDFTPVMYTVAIHAAINAQAKPRPFTRLSVPIRAAAIHTAAIAIPAPIVTA
jgi:hypothetical protein